jgi:uncharacterized protein (TIGR03382 family)
MMVSARERKRKIMANKADAAALADKSKRKGGGGNTIARGRPSRKPPTAQPAPSEKSFDFEDDTVEGELAAPDGNMVDAPVLGGAAPTTPAPPPPPPGRFAQGPGGVDSGDVDAVGDFDGDSGEPADEAIVASEKRGACAGCASTGQLGGGALLLMAVLLLALRPRRRLD